MIYLLLFGALAIISVVLFIRQKTRESRRESQYRAASTLVKEMLLREAMSRNAVKAPERRKQVLLLDWEDGKKENYAFDPDKGVRIGRDVSKCQLTVLQDSVSGEHCIIFASQGQLYVKDLGSTNGTWIKRSFHRPFRVSGTQPVQSGDKLIVGGIYFEVHSMWIDTAYL